MKKRILCMILACVMLLSAVPMLAIAAEAEVAFTASFYEEAQAGKITYDTEAATVSYNGDWKVVILEQGTYAPILLERMNPRMEEEGLWAVTPTAHGGITEHGWSQWWWGSLPGSGALNLENYGIGFSNPQGIVAYQYTVMEEGKFDLAAEIDNFEAPANGNSEFFLSVMVNGKMVWPKYGGTYSYASTFTPDSSPAYVPFLDEEGSWYKVGQTTTVEQLNEALASLRVKVEKGDVVSFCYRLAPYEEYEKDTVIAMPKITATVSTSDKIDQYLSIRENKQVLSTTLIEGETVVLPEYTGSAIFLGWDLNGDRIADAKPGATLKVSDYDADIIAVDAVTVDVSYFMDNLPVLDKDNLPQYLGDWQIGAFDKKANAFSVFGSPTDPDGIISVQGSVWGNQGGGLYTNDGKIAFSGCEAGENYLNEIRYTAPYNGAITFGLNSIVCRREINDDIEDYIAFNFAVYLNGEKIWPTDSDFFKVQSPTTYTERGADYDALADFKAAGFPLSLSVEKGDVISFRTQEGNANSWMMYADPVVTYDTVGETPLATGSSLTLGTDLSLNFLAQLIAPREGAQMGMECWTSKPTADMLSKGGTKLEGAIDEATGFYAFTYSGLSAKQMADLVYVRPYSYVGEDVIYGDVTSYSIQAYAESALGRNEKLDDVLYALLCYGANAQVVFDHNKTNPANANVPVDERVGSFEGELNNVYSNADGANKIKSVCLLLDNELGFKFMIDSVEGAESYELEFSYNADFSASEKVAMEAVWEGREQKGIIHMSLADIGKTFYARVIVDGEAGATLTYSFDSYFDRMQDDCSEGLYYTLASIATLDRALRAYLA